MKKVFIMFSIIFIINLIIPMFWCFAPAKSDESTTSNELVTIFEEESTTKKS